MDNNDVNLFSSDINMHLIVNDLEITNVVIPESIKEIGSRLFSGFSSITSVTIPNSVTSIGWRAFRYCSSLNSIEIPNSVTSIGSSVFAYCSSLAKVKLPDSLTEIGMHAFLDCSSLDSIIIPNSVKSIETEMFKNCSSLATIVLPDSLTEIEIFAFRKCLSLKSIVIPKMITLISERAFEECYNLNLITIEAENPPTVDIVNEIHPAPLFADTVRVPCGSKQKYETANYWRKFDHYEEILPSLILNVNDKKMGDAIIINPHSCENDIAKIKAEAYEGYEFVKWSDDNVENPRSIVVNEDIELTAIFEKSSTAVDNLKDANIVIYTKDGLLYIEGVETDYHVIDATGRLIYTGRDAQLQLPRGVYMIAIGGEVQKVVL